MQRYPCRWWLLPGNHDYARNGGLWDRVRRKASDNIILLTDPSAQEIEAGVWLLPAPLIHRHNLDDPTELFDSMETPGAKLRIGLAHGSIRDFTARGETKNQIAPDRAKRSNLDYLALGDWHGTLEIAPRTWYAGTPEPDRFRANDAGNVLLVELDQPGEPPAITRIATARHGWRQLDLDLTGVTDLTSAVEGLLADATGREHALVQLTMAGVIDLAGRTAVEAALERLAAEVCHLELRDRLLAEPSERDLLALAGSAVVGTVARELAALAAEDPAQREIAALALRLLYLEHHRLGSAA
jgi:hypothetical protein